MFCFSSFPFPDSRFAPDPSNLELGTWNLELGTWNLELGTWNLELGTSNFELYFAEKGVWTPQNAAKHRITNVK
jgi:hypothetical protein